MIASLPERCRKIVELRKIEGWSQKEIAAYLGMTEKTLLAFFRRSARSGDRCGQV